MTACNKLTAADVLAAVEGDFYDGRGLLLRARPPSASWVLRYTAPTGRRREMGLGIVLRMDLAEAERSLQRARSDAAAARDLLASGVDPIDQREEQKAEAKVHALRSKGLTMLRVFRRYHEKCVEPVVSSKYARQWTYETENHCPRWFLDMPAIDVKATDVLRALREAQHGAAPSKVDNLRQRMDQVMEWMINSGLVGANPAGVRRNTRSAWIRRFAGDERGQDQRLSA